MKGANDVTSVHRHGRGDYGLSNMWRINVNIFILDIDNSDCVYFLNTRLRACYTACRKSLIIVYLPPKLRSLKMFIGQYPMEGSFFIHNLRSASDQSTTIKKRRTNLEHFCKLLQHSGNG